MSGAAAPAIAWFRRDLRLSDNPALLAAAESGPVLAVFVLDPRLVRPSGTNRLAYLYATLGALDQQLRKRGGSLTIRTGRPDQEIARLVDEVGAACVHIAADFGPYGAARDEAVERALASRDVPLIRTGSPYAVAPGRVRNGSGDPYRVFTPFYRAWRAHGWRAPAADPSPDVTWLSVPGEPIPSEPACSLDLPAAGEPAAHNAWTMFRDQRLGDYAAQRNNPAADATSHLSVHLKLGTIHPRTLLAEIDAADDAFARQLAWREFYAAVLHFWPDSARQPFQPAMAKMPYATGDQADQWFDAWATGRTGYPIVDAGMRQLTSTGWMHNRLRLITASFLVKDLHLDWRRGAAFFLQHLLDGDLASNQHGWQWTAGTGTDAAPYYRILNPVTQSRRFDPDGTYIRRWVPELRDLSHDAIHTPWELEDGPPAGYPTPMVDHADEREIALAHYASLKN